MEYILLGATGASNENIFQSTYILCIWESEVRLKSFISRGVPRRCRRVLKIGIGFDQYNIIYCWLSSDPWFRRRIPWGSKLYTDSKARDCQYCGRIKIQALVFAGAWLAGCSLQRNARAGLWELVRAHTALNRKGWIALRIRCLLEWSTDGTTMLSIKHQRPLFLAISRKLGRTKSSWLRACLPTLLPLSLRMKPRCLVQQICGDGLRNAQKNSFSDAQDCRPPVWWLSWGTWGAPIGAWYLLPSSQTSTLALGPVWWGVAVRFVGRRRATS